MGIVKELMEIWPNEVCDIHGSVITIVVREPLRGNLP